MDVEVLVKRFVDAVNKGNRKSLDLDEVPSFLRDGECDELSTGWKIVAMDNSARIDDLSAKLPKRFPPSYFCLLTNYSVPAFEVGPLMLFANTGQPTEWELGKRIFADPNMSSFLLESGYIQIGNPHFYDYDAVCFDSNRGRKEFRIVQIDHEDILCKGEVNVVKELAPSFIDLMKQVSDNAHA